jgi:hypothetical protein
MSSRKQRKRYRRQAEASAHCPGPQGVWGSRAPTTRADLVLLRHAINQSWAIADDKRPGLVLAMMAELDSADVRRSLSAIRVLLAMERANIRAEHEQLRARH